MSIQPKVFPYVLNTLRDIVIHSGGTFSGIQDPMFPEMLAKISITNPITSHTLYIPFNHLHFDAEEIRIAIEDGLAEDTAAWENHTVRVKVEDLQRIAKILLNLSKEMDALSAGRKK